jgi:glycerol kinase
MQADLNFPLLQIAADGGASRNDALMQFQADMLGRPVTRGDCPEVSALGAAMMAAQGLGRPISAAGETTIFKPRKRNEDRTAARSAWRKAVQQTLLHASSETQGDPQ